MARAKKPAGRHRWHRRPWGEETVRLFRDDLKTDLPVSRYWDCSRCGDFVYDLATPPRTRPRNFVYMVGKCSGVFSGNPLEARR